MKWLDNYIDKWISKKALSVLKHKLAMAGFKTIIEEKSDYYNISVVRYNKQNETPKFYFAMNFVDGLEFYNKWLDMDVGLFAQPAQELFEEEKQTCKIVEK